MPNLLVFLVAIAVLLWVVPVWVTAEPADYDLEVLAEPLEHPWSITFLPDGAILVTERPGRLRVVAPDGHRPTTVAGLPEVFSSGQAGLFDVLLAEDFEDSGTLFLSFAWGDADANHTRIVRARFDGQELLEVTPIFTTQPPKSGDAHYGGRMAWMADGTLLLGTGDGFYFREESQNLESHLGKIIRIRVDGSVPDDNPFVGTANAMPEIYSYGHRNVQAIVNDRDHDVIYAHEHGPRGGDELNAILPGRNYGWPVISHGKDYSRALITPFTSYEGMEQPLLHWTPSIAPSGMTLYDGESFPQWRRSLFVAALAEESVRRIPLLDGGQLGEQDILFEELGQRIRDIRSGPDGALYLVTDEADGQLIRVTPSRLSRDAD